jgi:hypothetical protein
MTNCPFGARAPITPPTSSPQGAGNRRVVRGAWLIARLVRQEPVSYKEFQERFGRPGRTFCCEVAALRAVGIFRGSKLLQSPNMKTQGGSTGR